MQIIFTNILKLTHSKEKNQQTDIYNNNNEPFKMIIYVKRLPKIDI